MTVRRLWVHEDEEGLRCLWPVSALPHLACDVEASARAAERNALPEGAGFTDVHVVSQPKASFADHGLAREAVMSVLSTILPRFESVQVGDGKYFGWIDDDALCFGFDSMCFIHGATRDGLVGTFFFNAWTDDAEQLAALRRAIEAIDKLCPAALVDYWIGMAGRVADGSFMSGYLQALVARTEAAEGVDEIRNESRRDKR